MTPPVDDAAHQGLPIAPFSAQLKHFGGKIWWVRNEGQGESLVPPYRRGSVSPSKWVRAKQLQLS